MLATASLHLILMSQPYVIKKGLNKLKPAEGVLHNPVKQVKGD